MSKFPSICDFEVIPGIERLQVASACTDSQLRIFDLTNEKETAYLRGHMNLARSVKLMPSPSVPGYTIISAGYDGTVRTWTEEVGTEAWQCVHIFSYAKNAWIPLAEGGELLGSARTPKKVYDMQIDGKIAYIVGEKAEIVALDLDTYDRDNAISFGED
jgi:WD40 repeat protein